MRPGHEVVWVDSGPNATAGTSDTRQGFAVAEASRGPIAPRRVTSLAAAVAIYGTRQAYSFLYDGLETAFAEGCPAVWVSRIVSSTATTAGLNLSDGTATCLRINFAGPGTEGNSIQVRVLTNADDTTIPAGSFRIRILDTTVSPTATLEDSPIFATKADALSWGSSLAIPGQPGPINFVIVDAASTGNPIQLAATSMTGGLDNRGAIADSDWQTAIDRFTMDLGPGQVAMFGQTIAARRLMVVAHALARNRHWLLDFDDTSVIATLTASAAAINAAPGKGARNGSGYWPWHKVPPAAGTIGSRTVPPSAAMMGLFARAENEGGDPGIAAAGEQMGVFRFVTGLSQDTASLSDANATTLNDAGVNIARVFQGISNPVQYGNRTPRIASLDPLWREASGSRLAMAIAARGDQVIRAWVHRRVSGPVSLAQLQSELSQVLEPLRLLGALYGATPQEAYDVDAMSVAVNPLAQLESGLLKAAIEYRTSPTPERVSLQLARTSITVALA
jgi:hypothetical protein